MANGKADLEQIILVQLVRLDAKILGSVLGLTSGLLLFLTTNWLVIKGGEVVGPHLGLLGQFFPGYEVSFVGSLLGFAYAFVVGFVFGYALALVYNAAVRLRERKHPSTRG